MKPGSSQRHVRRPPRRIWFYAFLAAVGMMTVSASASVGIFMALVRSLPPIEQLEHYDPPEITRIFDRTGTETVGEFKRQKRQVVTIREIPQKLRNAFIAIEDARFREHFGVDPIGVARAMLANLKAGRIIQGGSTITQQLTRNILPQQVGFAQHLERKLKEAVLAIQIERRYSKNQILEFYLNHIAFHHNSFGVEAAADTYFSKDLDDLTLGECAVLAGIPKATARYNPISNPRRALERRNIVLRRMYALGFITAEQFQQGLAEPLNVRRGRGPVHRYPYFVDGLRRNLLNAYGLSSADLLEDGLRITSTLDMEIQNACIEALSRGLVEVERMWQERKRNRAEREREELGDRPRTGQIRLMKITSLQEGRAELSLHGYTATVDLHAPASYYEPEKILREDQWLDVTIESVDSARATLQAVAADRNPIQGSIVVLDAHTGEVLGLVGGTEGWYNRALQGGRQVGSCFKPFFYTAAFESGYQPCDIIVDEPVEYKTYGEPYRPVNYGREGFHGPITLIQALEESRNVATIRLFEAIGLDRAVERVERFNFTRLGEPWSIPAELSSCLGTVDCSPFEMASAYQVLANNGVGAQPAFFREIHDTSGRIAVPRKSKEVQVLDPVKAYQTQYLLRQVVIQAPAAGRLGGTGYREIGANFPSPPNPPICAKTGTTTDNRDAWFCGFTPDLVIVVQVGFDRPRSLGPRMTGGRVAGPIWRDTFKRILKTRAHWRMTYDAPSGLEFANICSSTGKRASDYCETHDHFTYLNVPFPRGRTPRRPCDGNTRTPIIEPVGEQYAYWYGETPQTGFARRPGQVEESGPSPPVP